VKRDVFMTGGTGYLGRPLIEALLARGHTVRALTREASKGALPAGSVVVTGNALEPTGWMGRVAPADTFVHLIGTPHPNPLKAAQFQAVDLTSIRAAVQAATAGGVRHFVYVSVAHPAPVMRAFIEVRQQGEALLGASGLSATILRPWYILGSGHRWAHLLQPFYTIARLVPSTRASAERLALLPRSAVIDTLVRSIESPPEGVRVLEAPEIVRGLT
jgi:uncharacterized protein YbjT (DUF2867 family)